jgi:hypothetical protein
MKHCDKLGHVKTEKKAPLIMFTMEAEYNKKRIRGR